MFFTQPLRPPPLWQIIFLHYILFPCLYFSLHISPLTIYSIFKCMPFCVFRISSFNILWELKFLKKRNTYFRQKKKKRKKKGMKTEQSKYLLGIRWYFPTTKTTISGNKETKIFPVIPDSQILEPVSFPTFLTLVIEEMHLQLLTHYHCLQLASRNTT